MEFPGGCRTAAIATAVSLRVLAGCGSDGETVTDTTIAYSTGHRVETTNTNSPRGATTKSIIQYCIGPTTKYF